MSDSELIDWEQLSMIFGDEDEELDEDMAELFQEFIEDGTERFVSIAGMSFEGDKESIAKEAHKLKGSAANFGFASVADELANIEDNVGSLAKDAYESGLARAREQFGASVSQVMGRYPALQA